MKKQLLIAFALALLVPWAVRAQSSCVQTIPFFEGFETTTAVTSYSSAGSVPTCWNAYSNGTSAGYSPHVVSGTGSYIYFRTGNNGLVFSASTSSSNGSRKYLVLPPMSVPLNQLQLSFWMCPESVNYGSITVGYMTSDDTSTFTAISTYPCSMAIAHSGNGLQVNTGLDVELILSSVPATATRLALRYEHSTSSTTWSCCIDDVSLDYIPTCPRVDSMAVVPSSNEATLSWTETGTATNWEVTIANATGVVATDFATTNSYTFTTLTPNTSYTASVRAVCGVDDTSLVRSLDFRTLCESIATTSLPWTYGFEDASGSGAAQTFNDCLGRHTNNSTAYPYPSSSYANNGNYSCYFYSTTTYRSYLTLPPFEDNVEDLFLSFWAYKTSASYGNVYVGVMSDPNDISTFDTIATVQVSAVSTWEFMEVPLSSYTGNGGVIALLSPTTGTNYVYIDDITVSYPPTCFRPTDVTLDATTLTSSTANLNITHDDATSFLVLWHMVGQTLWDTLEVTGTTIELQGLTMGMPYEGRVYTLCGSDTSDGFKTFSFNAGCGNLTYSDLPYSETFESYGTGSTATINSCWSKGTNSSTAYPYPYSTAAINGSRGLYFYGYYPSSASSAHIYSYAVLPRVDESVEMSDLMVNFMARRYSSTGNYYSLLYVGLADTNVFASAAELDSNVVWIDTIDLTPLPVSTIQAQEISFENYTGNNRYVVFYAPTVPLASGATYNYNYFYADDIVLRRIPTCYWPTEVSLDQIGTDEATLSWTPDARTLNPSSWVVEYGPEGFVRGTGTIENVSSTSVTLTNLLPNTGYDVYVSADCGGEVSDPAAFSFRTLCTLLETLPYTQDFENAEIGSTTSDIFVNCMVRLNNGTQYFGYPYVAGSTYNHTPGGAKGLYWYNNVTVGTYGDYQTVVLPGVDASMYPANTLQVRFWAKPSSTSYSPQLQVGVMTNPLDNNTFELVKTVDVRNVTEWQEFTVLLSSYTGNGQYVAIRAIRPASSWYVYVDDIALEEMPACPPIVNIEAAPTVGAALLTWGHDPDFSNLPQSYTVVYDSVGSTGTPMTVTVSEPAAFLTGLAASTQYKAYITPDCGTDGLGAMDSIVFTTGDLGCAQLDPASIDTVLFSNSTSGQSGCLAYSSYGNTIYQAVWTAAELTAAGLTAGPITGIDLGFTACASYAKEFTIFMGTTATSSISNATMEDPNQQTQVYGPALHPTNTSGWQHYNFTTPFQWDGVSNIIITTFMNQSGGSQTASTNLTGYYVSASNKARYRYKDSNPFTLSDFNSGTAGTTYSYRAAIHFYTADCLVQATGAAPNVSVVNVEPTEVTLAWAPGYDETSWDVDYRLHNAATWTNVATGVTSTTYTITGLNAATKYDFRVGYSATDGNDYYGNVTATTPCVPMAMPYTENFDSITTSTTAANAGVMPPCWDFTMTGTSTYQAVSYYPGVYYNANYAASGNYSLRLYGVSIVELPEMGASLDSLRLTFTDTITSASYGLIVGVMDNGSFLPIDTIELETGTRNYAEVFFRNYTGSSRTIALRNYYTTSTSTYTSYHYIDDIAVDYIPVCAHVDSLTVDSIDQTTATISWVPVNEETEWIVSDGTNTATVTATNYTFTGLTPNTSYTFEVRSVCGAGDTSEAATIQERTACALISTTPFVETFEAQPTGTSSTSSNFIPCWTRLNNGTSSGGYPYVSNNTTYNHTLGGSRGLYWYGSTTTGTYGDYMYVILPQIDVTALPVNTLQLSFWARSSSTSYNPVLEVGVMNSNSDTAFVPIQTINIGGNTEWTEFVVPFDSYTGTGSFVAIRALRPSSAWYAYVDDISLDVIPACARVEELTATNVLLNSATITWADTSDNTAWNVEYDSVAFVPGTGHMTAIHVTDTFAVITGLDSATTYHVYVYPDCDGDVYYRHATFTTLVVAPATVPYSCNFEDAGVNGWDLINGSQVNHWMVGNATNNGGSRSLYITNNDADNAYTITTLSFAFASRTFSLDPGNYICSFDWKAWGESSFDFIRAALVPANTTIVAGQYCGFDNTSAMPAGGIALDGGYRLNLDSTWNTQVTEFSLDASGVYKLVFLWRNDGSSGTQPPAAIDNVSLVVNTCPRVENVVANLSANSIDLSWTPGGTETSWQVTVGTTSTVVNTPAYTVTGLVPDNDYTVSIRAICAAGDTSFAYTETFHTPCYAVSLPYSEDFDALTTGTATSSLTVVPDCWSYILTGSATYQTPTYYPGVYYSSSNAHSGSYSYRLYGEGYHMLPPMPTSLDSLQLTFWDYTTGASYGLEVGVMEGNTFVPVEVISTPTSTHVEHTVYFGTYTGTSRIIAFRNYYTTSTTSNYSYHYIDNVQVDYLPTCAPVYDIHAVSAGVDDIVVDWSDMTAGVSQWQVRYGVGSNTTTINATSHPVTISGLDTLTTYQVSVRPICSATDTGDWSVPVSLGTEMCDNASVAYTGQTTGTGYYTPVNNYYHFTLTETIIDSAELAGIGDISAIAYSYAHTTASTDKTDVTIWIQPTTKSVFTGNTDLILLDTTTAVQVYNGALNCSQGWNYFDLDTDYVWDGHSNLVVIVDDNSDEYDGSSYVFNTSNCTGYKTLAWYSDSQNPDPTSTTFSGNKSYYQYRATMKLVSCSSVCREPSIDTVLVGETTAALSWSGLASSYEVYAIAGTWDEPTTGIATTGTSYTFTDLTPGTEYSVGVRAVCENGTSEWVYVTITTDEHPCYAPSDLTVSEVTYSSAVLNWTPGEAETEWELHLTGTNLDTTFNVTTNPYILTGLRPGAEYSVTVAAVCSATQISEATEAQTFTTLTCQPVSGVTANDITVSGATISWTAPTGVDNFEIEYGLSGFGQGAGTRVTVTGTSYTLAGLAEATMYDVLVRSVCAAGVYSDWSNRASFETLDGGSQEGIEDIANANIALYPNPATTTVTLTGFDGQATVTIVDMNGRAMGEYTANDNTLTIDLTGYAQGAYFVRITGEQVNAIRKLIVK